MKDKMKDKIYFCSSDFFALTNARQKFVLPVGNDWQLQRSRWGNYCAEMADRGVNMFRWVGWCSWNKLMGNDPAKALTPFLKDGSGKYILGSRNDRYWQLAEEMVRIMNYPSPDPGNAAPGITLWLDLAMQYLNDTTGDIFESPWRNNVEGFTSLYDPAAWSYFEKYMLEWFRLAKGYTDEQGIVHPPLKIVFGMGNEMEGDSLDFCAKMLRVMDREMIWPFSWGIPAEIPSNGGNDLFKALPMIIYREGLFMWHWTRQHPDNKWDCSVKRPVHGCGGFNKGVNILEQAISYFAGHDIAWIVSDDGVNPKPGATEWDAMVERLCTWRGTDLITFPWIGIDHPFIAIEHLPDDRPWDECRDEQLVVFDAMARPYNRIFGLFENQGSWKTIWKDQPPVDPQDPVNPKSAEPWWNWKRIINVRRWTWQAWVPVGLLSLWLLITIFKAILRVFFNR